MKSLLKLYTSKRRNIPITCKLIISIQWTVSVKETLRAIEIKYIYHLSWDFASVSANACTFTLFQVLAFMNKNLPIGGYMLYEDMVAVLKKGTQTTSWPKLVELHL